MNWLDLALTTPTVGILFEPRLQFPHEMLDALKPTLEAWKRAHPNLLFYIPAKAALIEIRPGDGFVVNILGNNVVTSFGYEPRMIDVPGSLPIMKTPAVANFSDLMVRAIELTAAVCDRLHDPPILVNRVGIVADCRVDGKSMPPGMVKFIEYAGKPWGSRPLVVSGMTSVDLPSADHAWTHRCHHTVDFNEDERPNDVRVRLDWQMMPKDGPRLVQKGSARRLLEDAVRDADRYFEQFGGGGLNYA